MLGRKIPYFYELELEKFRYSNEQITTGVDDVDQVVTDSAYTLHLNVGVGYGQYTNKELVYQSSDSTYANATTIATVQSWIPSSSTLSVSNIMGEFIDNFNIIGASSGARYILANFDPLNSPATKESYDNEYINTSGNLISDFSENNPFGGL